MKQETVTYDRQSNISQNQSIDISIDPNNMIQAFEAFVNYSYPLKSIIREITSNCFDAHIAIDIDHHVEIRYSKTEFGRMLIFRDFGIGLDEDRMNNIFIHMFRSDKRESNRLIGTFGMGSKSPFGYTDMFYVESWVEGTHYLYQLEKTERGFGVTPLEENPYDGERRGTDIKIPLKDETSDDDLVKAIKSELSYFHNVIFTDDESFLRPMAMEKFNEMTIYEDSEFKHSTATTHTNLHLSMGPVSYPIDRSSFDIPDDLWNTPIAIRFEIGDLDIVWNRENIKYNKKNITTIQSRIDKLHERFEEESASLSPLIDTKKDFEKLLNAAFTNSVIDIKRDIPSHITKEYVDKVLSQYPNNIFFSEDFLYRYNDVDKGDKKGKPYKYQNNSRILYSDVTTFVEESYTRKLRSPKNHYSKKYLVGENESVPNYILKWCSYNGHKVFKLNTKPSYNAEGSINVLQKSLIAHVSNIGVDKAKEFIKQSTIPIQTLFGVVNKPSGREKIAKQYVYIPVFNYNQDYARQTVDDTLGSKTQVIIWIPYNVKHDTETKNKIEDIRKFTNKGNSYVFSKNRTWYNFYSIFSSSQDVYEIVKEAYPEIDVYQIDEFLMENKYRMQNWFFKRSVNTVDDNMSSNVNKRKMYSENKKHLPFDKFFKGRIETKHFDWSHPFYQGMINLHNHQVSYYSEVYNEIIREPVFDIIDAMPQKEGFKQYDELYEKGIIPSFRKTYLKAKHKPQSNKKEEEYEYKVHIS